MASEYYGLNRGQHSEDVTQGSSTGSTDIEVRIDLTKGLGESDVMILLDEIKNYILSKDKWPPA